jgi:hypothetical protein
MKIGWGSLAIGILVGWLLSGVLSRATSKVAG